LKKFQNLDGKLASVRESIARSSPALSQLASQFSTLKASISVWFYSFLFSSIKCLPNMNLLQETLVAEEKTIGAKERELKETDAEFQRLSKMWHSLSQANDMVFFFFFSLHIFRSL